MTPCRISSDGLPRGPKLREEPENPSDGAAEKSARSWLPACRGRTLPVFGPSARLDRAGKYSGAVPRPPTRPEVAEYSLANQRVPTRAHRCSATVFGRQGREAFRSG